MKSRIPSKSLFALLVVIIIASVFTLTASADMGPKPSLTVDFESLPDAECYGTLLSYEKHCGPHSSWNGDEQSIYVSCFGGDVDIETWRAFAEYEDSDGYFFLQGLLWNVGEIGKMSCGYYPPQKFKILLYFPETDTYYVSGIYERYAFDTYYTINCANIDPEVNGEITSDEVKRSYDWWDEGISMLARIVATIAIEIAIALLFGFRDKRSLLVLLIVNCTTQVLLNMILNILNFNGGAFFFIIGYVLIEMLIIAIEAIVYSVFLRVYEKRGKNILLAILYAIISNVVSFCTGILIASLLPGMF